MEAFTTPARDAHQPLETVKVRLESCKQGFGASELALLQQIAFLSIGGNLLRPAPRSLTLEDVLLRGGWFQVFEEVVRLLYSIILQVEDYLKYSKTISIFRASQPPPPETSMDAAMENHKYRAILKRLINSIVECDAVSQGEILYSRSPS